MGGGKKSKSGSSSLTKSHSKSSHGQSNKQSSSPRKKQQEETIDDQLRQSLEVEIIRNKRNSLVTWKECLFLIVVFTAILTVLLLVAMLAGTAISLQFYKETNTLSRHRVTSMDSDIQQVLQRLGNHDDVQELPPLLLPDSTEGDSFPSNTPKTTTQHQGGFQMSQPLIQPSLCPDGVTMGFQDWNTLKDAIHEANRRSAQRFLEWNKYLANIEDDLQQLPRDDLSLYYEQDVFFTICPDTTLYARKGPIYVNSENIVLECQGCTIQVGGSHLAFGPNAKNVLVRGITFRGATTGSLHFYQNGCDAIFEDCYWYANASHGNKFGAVADVNSTSSVVFHRCGIDDANNVAKHSPRGGNQALSTSLSIRS
jgi:hypothetical protein